MGQWGSMRRKVRTPYLTESSLLGFWDSGHGHCLFDRGPGGRLTYQEALNDGPILQGWLQRQLQPGNVDELAWQAGLSTHALDFPYWLERRGDKPPTLEGHILITLRRNEESLVMESRIRVGDEEQWGAPVRFWKNA